MIKKELKENNITQFIAYPVLFIPGVGPVEELEGHIVVLVEPLHHEGLEPRRVLGHRTLVRRDIRHVGFEQPFYPK